MENRLSSASHGAGITAPLRDLLHIGTAKENLAPELKDALVLLNLKNLEALENHFLATDAFLKPWSLFRDSWFLLQAQASSRASPPGQLQATGVLWFYTCFLEGELRYDSRCDDSSSVYTTDESKYGTFDNEHWGVEEYEKMLYAWLLQEFRVGKARNPFGFKYFEHRNVVAAWKNVFVPIINAVRDSYDVKGRRHYGRLAKFIEDRFPSRLAFPEGNVAMHMSATPYRMVSVPREQGARPWPGSPPELVPRADRAITKKEYAEFEQELRVVYPKYGQVVERPKFKTRMEDWLAAQKLRAQQKKRVKELHGKKAPALLKRSGRESPLFGCRGLGPSNDASTKADSPSNSVPRRSATLNTFSSSPRSPSSTKLSPGTPTKRVPYGMYGSITVPMEPKEKKNSRKNRSYSDESGRAIEPSKVSEHSGAKHSMEHKPFPGSERIDNGKPLEPPAICKPEIDRKDSDGVYSLIRGSNPFTDSIPTLFGMTREAKERASWESEESSMYPMSAVPKPLFNEKSNVRKPHQDTFEESPFVRAVKEASARAPSYEGNEYGRDIAPSSIANKMHATLEHNAYDGGQSAQPSRIPGPVQPAEQETQYFIPQAVPWPGQSPPLEPPREWSGDNDNDESPAPPPVPPKNPQRYNSFRSIDSGASSRPNSLQPPVIPTLGPRIISVENIRAHLNISPQTSHEDLSKIDEEGVEKTLPVLPLRTYNSHMFPRQERKATPVRGLAARRYQADGEYEMEVLKQGERN